LVSGPVENSDPYVRIVEPASTVHDQHTHFIPSTGKKLGGELAPTGLRRIDDESFGRIVIRVFRHTPGQIQLVYAGVDSDLVFKESELATINVK
jgi:hypothetical protein